MALDPKQALAGLPHDVRGLADEPSALLRWGGFLAGALIAALLVALVVIWLKRRRREPAFVADPWTLLLGRITGLEIPPLDNDKAREDFYYNLSLLLREGIERRTGLNATDLTFSELKGPLTSKLPLRTDDVKRVLAFLERADLVKFAEAPASAAAMAEDRDSVRGWVDGFRPREGDINPAATLSTRTAGGGG